MRSPAVLILVVIAGALFLGYLRSRSQIAEMRKMLVDAQNQQPLVAADGDDSPSSLHWRLREAEREVATLKAELARKAAGPSSTATRDPDIVALESNRDRFRRVLTEEGVDVAIADLSELYFDGDLTALDVMNLAVALPDFIVAGLSDHDLPEEFRSVLLSGLENVDDPLDLLADIAVEDEPSQRLSARMADIVNGHVDDLVDFDDRAAPVIRRLLSGNDMHGNKINLYPSLAQLAGLGDEGARQVVESFLSKGNIFTPGIEALLDPPDRDEDGIPLAAAVIFSIQFNKGNWPRPRQFKNGDVVLSIGDSRVTDRASFFAAIKRYKGGTGDELIPARVYVARGDGNTGYDLVTRELDPGDFRLMYGVRSIRALD